MNTSWSQFFSKHERVLFIAVSSVTVIFLLFASLWRLSASPATWFDEGINLGIAKSLVITGVYSLPIAPERHVLERSFLITTNYPVLLPVALSISLFGSSLAVARIPQVIYLLLFCLLSFSIVLKVYGSRWAALLSVLLIATFAPFYANGKAVLGEVPGLVFFLGALLVLPSGKDTKRLLLAGLLLGLSAATKPFYLIVLGAVAVSEVIFFWKQKKILVTRSALLFVGILVPLIAWVATIIHPLTVSTFWSTIGYYSNSYAATNVFNQVGSNFFRFFTESTPIHFLILALAGAFFILQRFKRGLLTEPEMAIGIFVVLTVGWYLKTPGWYRYFFPAHLLLFLFFPIVMLSARFRRLGLAVLAGLLILQAAYLITKTKDPLYYAPAATRFAAEANSLILGDQPILTINTPSMGFLFAQKTVYQFLQINPKLYFGSATLQDAGGEWYPFIVTSGSIESTAIVGLEQDLHEKYTIILQEDKYTLLKRKNL
jgi:hypothetical protein